MSNERRRAMQFGYKNPNVSPPDSLWDELCKDPDYPCGRCDFKTEPERCTMTSCGEWRRWFHNKWEAIHSHGTAKK